MSKNNDADWQEHPTRRLDNRGNFEPQRQDTVRFQDQTAPDGVGPTPREPGKAQARTLICSECGGAMVWGSTETNRWGTLNVVPYFGPMLMNGTRSNIVGLVCMDCGFTKFYTMQPRKLVE